MKVEEIISEVWYNPMSWGKTAAPAAKQATATLTGDAAKLARITAWAKKNGMETALQAKAKQSFLSKVGSFRTLFFLIGYAEIGISLWYNLHTVEAMYEAGEIKQAELERWRDWWIGYWGIIAVMPFVAKILSRTKILTMIVTAIAGLITGGFAPAAFAAVALSVGSSSLIFAGITSFMETPMAQNWLANHFFRSITMVGHIADEGWDILRKAITGKGYYEKEEEIQKQKNPDAWANDNTKRSGGGADGNPNSGPNAVIVGGVRITDKDGYLRPDARVNPNVQLAVKYGTPEEKAAYDKVAAKGRPPLSSQDKDIAANGAGQFAANNPQAVINPSTGKVADADPVTGKLTDRPDQLAGKPKK
jgi:hypothetical protein